MRNIRKTCKNEKSCQAALKKFIEGVVFIMKQFAFHKQNKFSYLSDPKREVVDLALTTAEAVVGLCKPSATQPCPSGTVCEKLRLKQDQRFDLTALIKTISPVREAGSERQCFDLELIDGSPNEAKDKTQVMKITVFQSRQSPIEDECRSCMDQHLAITLLQMYGSKSDKGEY